MRKIMTTLMVLTAIFVSTEAFAQEPAQAQQDVKPYKVYCEIVRIFAEMIMI